MFPAFLRKIIAPELIELIGEPRIKLVRPKIKLSRADRNRKLRSHRQNRAIRNEARSLAKRNGGLFPPQQGHRRPEWSSARIGKWAALNGNPAPLVETIDVHL